MSDCCSPTSADAAGSVQTITTSSTPATGFCPTCRDTGRTVEHRTILQMLKPELFGRLGNLEFYFCREPTCPVVYYSRRGDVEFSTDDLRVEVGVKMQGEPSAQICYCFGYTEKMIADELLSTGQTTIPKKITKLTKTGMCACEVRNPAGVCCLGNVNKTVKRLSEQYKTAVESSLSSSGAPVENCCSR
jgi:hypothetical protein